MRTEIIVDCRELEPPEPLNLVVSKLPLLNETNSLKMLHRLKPQMLLNILNENNFKYEIDESIEMFQILIWKE
jgi:uncharacterized protein (DUF2249 family)